MPTISRPDGATIHYEVHGEGYPLVCFAPGGVNSEITFWERSAINPVRDFGGDFRVILMDQRHAGSSFAPAAPFSYDLRSNSRSGSSSTSGRRSARANGIDRGLTAEPGSDSRLL